MQLSFLCMCVCVYLADNCDLAVTEFAAILDGENVLFIEGVVLQLLSYVWLFATPWTAAHQASPSFTISQSLLKLLSIKLVMPSKHLILYCPIEGEKVLLI